MILLASCIRVVIFIDSMAQGLGDPFQDAGEAEVALMSTRKVESEGPKHTETFTVPNNIFQNRILPGRQGQNLVLTVVYVLRWLDSGLCGATSQRA